MLNAALYERTQILVGDEGIKNLQGANVFLAGVGGVGGHCAEALVRAGIGSITLVDHDIVTASNKNRQLVALDSTIGKSKVQILMKRLRDVNANCRIVGMDCFLLPEEVKPILERQRYDVVVDCIDSVECKVALLAAAVSLNIRVFSSCGAGGRMDPSLVKTGDIFDTKNDGLARACRSQLRKRGVAPGDITVVSSEEMGVPPLEPQRQESGGCDRAMNGTISYMPSLFGLVLSAAVIKAILNPKECDEEKEQVRKRFRREESEKRTKCAKKFIKKVKPQTEISGQS